ncbi:MAG: ABC transporter permease [Actinobacteria bacterium]|nr:ABC transporter permease [Actinomycetota bacterium]
MSAMLTQQFAVVFIVAVIAGSIPLMLASLGETVGEQSGVLNLGIEGMMLIGGYVAFAVTLASGSFWWGMLAGGIAGLACGALFALLSVWMGLNQIVVGIAITLAGEGITSVLYDKEYSDTSPRLGLPDALSIPLLSKIPAFGESVFSQSAFFWMALAAAGVVAWWLSSTNPGLRNRAAGQMPASLDAAGGSVLRTRSWAVLAGGLFAGLGGAYLALISTGAFTPFMTNGVGYIAIIVTMLSRGRIRWVLVVSGVYGLTIALGTAMQLTTISLPTDVIQMFPFIVVMAMLVIYARGSYVPPALGTPYVRGAR